MNLKTQHYSKPIHSLIKRFIKPFPTDINYIRRLDEEFKIIEEKGFVRCFKQVSEIMRLSQGIPHLLRGSAASSLVCYYLGISHIDPIKHNIPLARFMNHTRDDQPDIDIDFPHWIRDEVIDRLHERYPGQVARISNRVMYKPKSALREALRAFGYNKFLPKHFKLNKVVKDSETRRQIREYADSLMGQQRMWSLHCGGVIVYNDKVPKNIMLDQSRSQIAIDKYDVEEQNLIKIDLLCNRGLSQLWEINDTPLHRYPTEDKLTSELLCKGDVIGLTQAESRTMRKTLIALQPKSMYDVALALALIRPAAADGGRKASYLRHWRRGDNQKQIVYDEDSINYISKLIGCDNSKADKYRRAFANQREGLMNEFISKIKHLDDKEKIIDNLNQLNKYSFCKGHALAYGQMVWALAYNKARDRQTFWKATLKHCNSSYRKWVHMREAVMSGIDMYNHQDGTPIQKLNLSGWWDESQFLPDMGVEVEDNKLYFRGLIANSRRIYRYGQKLILMSIGVDNGEFVDLIIKGKPRWGGFQIAEGRGTFKENLGTWYIDTDECYFSNLPDSKEEQLSRFW